MKDYFLIPIKPVMEILQALSDEEKGRILSALMREYFHDNEATREDDAYIQIRKLVRMQTDNPRRRNFADDPNALRHDKLYKEWRTAVFSRDDFTCQMCGVRGHKMNAHHIKPFAKYPDERLNVMNGVTLCAECHRETHRRQRNAEQNP